MALKPIPITVFTGFLGAGKTSIILSLLNRLPKDYKVVLLKNEFGDVEGKYNNPTPSPCTYGNKLTANWPSNLAWPQ